MTSIVTRFAPSPSGTLHLGGARTALFSWLKAHEGGDGRFYLRLEDTDAERSRAEYGEDILESLRWLGLQWYGEPVRQSQRTDLYQEAARQLQQQGNAYWCGCDEARLQSLRVAARSNPALLPYDGHCRELGLDEAQGRALRLRIPPAGWQPPAGHRDLIFGSDVPSGERLEDFVLRRSERAGAAGFTYHLCCVVDDHEMGITHVVRGVDHLSSIPRQAALYHCFGWQIPFWMHLPLVLDATGGRLSKRQGALAVSALRKEGYLPEAIVNFLVRLGWAQGNHEFFADLSSLRQCFADGTLGRASASQDLTRLQHLNKEHAKHLAGEQMLERYLQWRCDMRPDDEPLPLQLTAELLAAFLESCTTLTELDDMLQLLAQTPEDYAGKDASEAFSAESLQMLAQLHERFAALAESEWNRQTAKAVIAVAVEEAGGKFAAVGMPLRLALSGRKSFPAVDLLCAALGRNQVLARLQQVRA